LADFDGHTLQRLSAHPTSTTNADRPHRNQRQGQKEGHFRRKYLAVAATTMEPSQALPLQRNHLWCCIQSLYTSAGGFSGATLKKRDEWPMCDVLNRCHPTMNGLPPASYREFGCHNATCRWQHSPRTPDRLRNGLASPAASARIPIGVSALAAGRCERPGAAWDAFQASWVTSPPAATDPWPPGGLQWPHRAPARPPAACPARSPIRSAPSGAPVRQPPSRRSWVNLV
jgi:hypothetical protein